MDLLTTILTCSLYLQDDSLVRAIAESNSQSNPYFVLDASVDPTAVDPLPPSTTAAEAAARAKDILSKGGRPVLGLLELAPAWLADFRRPLSDAFDPCTNIAIGSAMLSAFDAECAHGEARATSPATRTSSHRAASPTRRTCVVAKYGEAIGLPDFTLLTRLELRYQKLQPPAVSEAPIFAPDAARAWGPGQLFVPLSLVSSTSPLP